jgi:hypothetical protein
MPSALSPLIADINAAVQACDDARFRRCLVSLHAVGEHATADDLTHALEDMASWLRGLNGHFAKAALLAGAFVEWGGSPLPLAAAVPGWAAYKPPAWPRSPRRGSTSRTG